MSLVELALAQPPVGRESYLRTACAEDSELFEEVWKYVEREQRMQGFLLEPLFAPAEEYSFRAGELLEGRFRIIREVAQGGMGVVYEAEDEKLGRRIAIKCAKAGFRKRLPPEVRHASEISHPNVCKIFEIHTAATEQGEVDFLTMEFLDGETLAERLDRECLPDKKARDIAEQLCAGLAEAHRNGVVHGDLKSSNVILTSTADGGMRAVITDFGLARRPETTQQTLQSGALGGTLDYMAPELLKGKQASLASDIYALGVILYELASGKRPYGAGALWEDRFTRRPASVRSNWDRVLGRCLDPDPACRFRDAAEVARVFTPRSRRWMPTAAAALVLALISGLVTWQRATAPRESVRLAMLPFESDAATAALAPGLLRETATQLSHLKGNRQTKFEFLESKLKATHALHGILTGKNGKVLLHVYVTDAHSQSNAMDWQAEYAPRELRYAPVALAGVVTLAFHLPALAANVNAAAQPDYFSGLSLTRRDSTIDQALPLLERAVAADSGSPLTYAALAEAQWFKYYATKDQTWLDRFTESVREAERRDPDLPEVHRVAGLLKANSGLYEVAATEYLRAIDLDPKNGDGYRRLGQVFEREDLLDKALEAYRRAAEQEPQHYRNQQALGSYYYARGNYSEAVEYLMKATEEAPTEPSAHFALGTAYMDLGQFPRAEDELRLALQLGENRSTLLELGLVLMYQGKDSAAIPYFSRALSRWPERPVLWKELGTAYRRTNQMAQSDWAMRRGLQLAEKDLTRDSRDGNTRAQLAYLCARLGDRQRAESEAAQALLFSPNDANTRFVVAETYEAVGDRDKTIEVVSGSPDGVLGDLSRWPDLAELHKDPRFLSLLASHHIH